LREITRLLLVTRLLLSFGITSIDKKSAELELPII